jgi:5-formyltetrahydrofolate cyclo-ligase
MPLAPEKRRLRAELRARRTALAAAMPDHGTRLGELASELDLPDGAIIGGYMALTGEADPAFLMAQLHARGHRLAVPRVAAKNCPLVFHAYEPGQSLAPGAFGVAEPDAATPVVVPDMLLVPLLGFDAAGHRLGYGGGFYDRTLQSLGDARPALRQTRTLQAVGIAYAGQEVGTLPVEPFDIKLDAVLTEKGFRRFD